MGKLRKRGKRPPLLPIGANVGEESRRGIFCLLTFAFCSSYSSHLFSKSLALQHVKERCGEWQHQY